MKLYINEHLLICQSLHTLCNLYKEIFEILLSLTYLLGCSLENLYTFCHDSCQIFSTACNSIIYLLSVMTYSQ